MIKTKVNPWTNPDFFDAGILIEGHSRLLFVNGQCAVSEAGESLHPGDMRAQMHAALDSVETVLKHAGMSLANIVRMNTYVTDVDAFFEHAAGPMAERLGRYDVAPPGVLSGITRLGRPELLIELEAIAAA